MRYERIFQFPLSHLVAGGWSGNGDPSGVKRAAREAIASVDSIIVVATRLSTVGSVRLIPRLRVERAGSSLPGRAVPGQDVCVEEVLRRKKKVGSDFGEGKKRKRGMFNLIPKQERVECGGRGHTQGVQLASTAWRRLYSVVELQAAAHNPAP